MEAGGQIWIGGHHLDLALGVLTLDGGPVHLRAKSFALLGYLARQGGRVVGKDELLDAVWPDVTVTEDTLTQTIRDLRRVLGEAAIRTVPRRGYVMVADTPRPQRTAQVPTLAILPALTVSDDPGDAGLVDALTEAIIQGVGRYGLVRVIARHTVFQLRPEIVPPLDAARRTGADWFVEGSARRLGGSLRLTLSLCAADDGGQVWSETTTLPTNDWAETLAAIPHRIVARLMQGEERAVSVLPVPSATADFGAWQHFLAGMVQVRSYGPGVNERARDHFAAAIACDPAFALPHAYLGLAEAIIGGYDMAPAEVLGRALQHALRGVALAPNEGRCHGIVAMIRLWQREFAAAEMTARRAVALNPSDTDLRAQLAYVLTMRGRGPEALALMDEATALNPLHPDWYQYNYAMILHLMGRHADAIPHIECLPDRGTWKETRLAACYAAIGDAAAAHRHLARAETLSPGWNPLAEPQEWLEYERPEDAAAYFGDVRRAIEMAAALGDQRTSSSSSSSSSSASGRLKKLSASE